MGVKLRGEIDQETYELLVQQAIRRDMSIPQYTAFLVRRGVRSKPLTEAPITIPAATAR